VVAVHPGRSGGPVGAGAGVCAAGGVR
jgi:hypothetical protein